MPPPPPMPPPKVAHTYLYTLRHPGIFARFYFPKRVFYQSEIVEALKDSVEESRVKKYLSKYARELLKEFSAYPYVLDPQRYTGRKVDTISIADARKRIESYRNPFFGWSTNNVEGAFLNTVVNELQDELTQVVQVIFRFGSNLEIVKKREGERLVQQAISWLLMNYTHRVDFPPIGNREIDRFIAEH